MGSATISSGIEAIKNYQCGFGFRTNEGALRNLRVNNRYIDAIKYVQEKYGLSSKVKIKFAKSLKKSYGVTDLSTGDIYIGPGAFQSNSLLKATIVHEYGHSILGRINVNGNWTWRYPQLSYNVTNKTLSFDGPLGYAQEIFNKGRMKINLSAIRNPKLNPLYNIWNLVTPGKYFARRWQFSIPLRFENNAILRLF